MLGWRRLGSTGIAMVAVASILATGGAVAGDAPQGRKWQIHVLQLTELSFLDQTLGQVKRGLRAAGFEEGRDFEITVRSAQGDVATVSQLVDAARDAGADVLIPLQSATLQTAIHRARDIPILFDVVADPFLLGAGTSDEDHLPNVTGVYSVFATEEMIRLIRQCTPGTKTLGVLFNPSEPQSAAYKDKLAAAAAAQQVSVAAIGVNAVAEMPDAALALTARDVDAILLIGMIPSLAFPSVQQAAARQHIPVYDYYDPNAALGAVAVLSMNFPAGDGPLADMLVEVLRGTRPADIPFHRVDEYRLIVNPQAAARARSAIPPSVLERADQVID